MFRFTIRDVLWLTVVVALFVAWRIDNLRPPPPFHLKMIGLELAVGEQRIEIQKLRAELASRK